MRLKKIDIVNKNTYTIQEIIKLTPYLDDIKPALTKKQRMFIYYYVLNGFQKVDAIRKSYNFSKGKDEAIKCLGQANQNLNLPYIKEARNRIINETIKDRKEIEKQLFEIWYIQATYDPAIFFNPDGSIAFKSWEEIPKKFRCCVEKFEVKYYGKDATQKVICLTLADKKFAQSQLDKYIQMTKESIEVNENINIVIGLENEDNK